MIVLAVLVTAQVLTVANSNLIAVALPQLSHDSAPPPRKANGSSIRSCSSSPPC
jgi:hypothetical protein